MDLECLRWICIKNERFPRVFSTRRMIKDGSEYYGPYTSIKTARSLLSLIKELYPLRTCAYQLSRENIEADKTAFVEVMKHIKKIIILLMINLIMSLLRTVIYPFKKCNILCCK